MSEGVSKGGVREVGKEGKGGRRDGEGEERERE